MFDDLSRPSAEILAIVTKSEARGMAEAIRRSGVRRVPLSEIKHDLSRFLRGAEGEEIVITRDENRPGC